VEKLHIPESIAGCFRFGFEMYLIRMSGSHWISWPPIISAGKFRVTGSPSYRLRPHKLCHSRFVIL